MHPANFMRSSMIGVQSFAAAADHEPAPDGNP
jgi:hypothetical protein